MDVSFYECKICISMSQEPVVTYCGHLFCWSCLYEWAETRGSDEVPCPTCCSSVKIKSTIPLYTSTQNHEKVLKAIPKRPKPKTVPFVNMQNNFNFGFGNQRGFIEFREDGGARINFYRLVPNLIFLLMFFIFTYICNGDKTREQDDPGNNDAVIDAAKTLFTFFGFFLLTFMILSTIAYFIDKLFFGGRFIVNRRQ